MNPVRLHKNKRSSRKLISNSVKDTLRIGRIIAKAIKDGGVVCLFGNLGSGKTVLTKGIAGGLGMQAEKIISPSFVLIRQYKLKNMPLFHFDLYRLRDPDDILALGYEEYLYGEGISVIEWADRLRYLMPKEYLGVDFSFKGSSKRILKINAYGSYYCNLLRKINENISS